MPQLIQRTRNPHGSVVRAIGISVSQNQFFRPSRVFVWRWITKDQETSAALIMKHYVRWRRHSRNQQPFSHPKLVLSNVHRKMLLARAQCIQTHFRNIKNNKIFKYKTSKVLLMKMILFSKDKKKIVMFVRNNSPIKNFLKYFINWQNEFSEWVCNNLRSNMEGLIKTVTLINGC